MAAGLIPFPEWFGRYGQADAQAPLVRYNVKGAAGAAMLAKYRAAVGTMTQRDKGEPCSWIFQWYTHQIRSDRVKATEVGTLPAAQRPLATEMWNTCQAHFGRPLQYFLPWHRMYVYFLERIVRKASGDPAFTLPYWDYIDSTQRPIPASFRSAVSNPLYRAARNTGNGYANVNAGQPIDLGQPTGTLNLDCMNETDYQQYSSQINQSPHGIVHGLIGNLQGMGSVPWAGNDPVFWLHHCNIDRLWASWNNWGRANPGTAAWRDQQFVFADENCNRVLVKVSDFAAIAPLGYSYERLVFSPPVPPRFHNLRLIAAFRIPRPDPGPLRIPLSDRPVTVRLTAPEGPEALAAGVRSLASAQTIRLTVRGLQAVAAPGILYHLYLNLPAGASPAVAQRHYVGSLSFFDAVAPDRSQMEGMDHGAMAEESMPSASFDITQLVRRLGRIDRLEVTVVPRGRPAARANAVIGNVELSAE